MKAIIALVILLLSAGGAAAAPCLDERSKQILVAALDDALQEHIASLFLVLLRDEHGQPQRAIAGATKAVASRNKALAAMEICAPGKPP